MGEIGTAHDQWRRYEQLPVNGRDWNSSRPMAEIRTAPRQWERLEQLTANGGDTNSSPSMGEIRTAHRQWARYEQLTANGGDTNSSPPMGEIGTAHGQWRRYEQLTANGRDRASCNFGRPKLFLRLRSNPAGGPPRIQAPSRKSRSFGIAMRNTRNGIRKRTGSPPKYLQTQRGRKRAQAAIYTHSWTRAQLRDYLETPHTRCFIGTAIFFTIAISEQLDWCGALS